MKVKDLKEVIKDLPDEASVELGKFIAISTVSKEAYTIRCDYPIIGIAQRDDEEICFIVGCNTPKDFIWLQKFGKVEPLE